MKFEKPSQSGSNQARESYRKSGETRIGGVVGAGRNVPVNPLASESFPGELPQRGRNREHTDELMTKADELEKLFLDYRLVHASPDPSEKQRAAQVLPEWELAPSENLLFFGFSRGKYYERYMEKREAWKTRRVDKEMKLQALQDYVDRSAELVAELFGTDEGYELLSMARSRVEKLRSFDSRSSISWTQQRTSSIHGEGKVDAYETSERISCLNNQFINQELSSTAPRRTVLPALRSATRKASDFASTKRGGKNECPVPQSFHNAAFPNQEKPKRSPGIGEMGIHSQRVGLARSKSNRDESLFMAPPKLATRSQSMRRSSASNSDSRTSRKTWA